MKTKVAARLARSKTPKQKAAKPMKVRCSKGTPMGEQMKKKMAARLANRNTPTMKAAPSMSENMKKKVAARLARSKTRKQKAAKPMKAGERPKKRKQAGASHVDEVVKKRLREMPKMRYYYSDTETSESE